jgi:hypothetical protein
MDVGLPLTLKGVERRVHAPPELCPLLLRVGWLVSFLPSLNQFPFSRKMIDDQTQLGEEHTTRSNVLPMMAKREMGTSDKYCRRGIDRGRTLDPRR